MGVVNLSSRAEEWPCSVPRVSSPGSGLEQGMKGGALALSFERGPTGHGLAPREFNSDTGVVGGLRGRLGEAPPRL